MALIIDDMETEELIRELAEEIGVSEAEAIHVAVEAELRRGHRQSVTRMIEADHRKRDPLLLEEMEAATVADVLYNENALPKQMS